LSDRNVLENTDVNDNATRETQLPQQSSIDPLDLLPPDEAKYLREYREQKAEEEQRRQRWNAIFDDLDALRENGTDDWRPAAIEFAQRFCAHDWLEVEAEDGPESALDSFVEALMNLLGYRREDIRNHGIVWKQNASNSVVSRLIGASERGE
jgi:hypothetical protein